MPVLDILRKLLAFLRQFDITVVLMQNQSFLRKCGYRAIDTRGFDAKLMTDIFDSNCAFSLLQQVNRL